MSENDHDAVADDDLDPSDQPASTAASSKRGAKANTHVAVSEETLTERVVTAYLASITGKQVSMTEIRDTLLSQINSEFSLENQARRAIKDKDGGIIRQASTSPAIPKVRVLDEGTVARVLLARHNIVAVSLSGKSREEGTVLAMYADMGPDEGVYVVADAPIARLANELKPSMTANAFDSFIKRMKTQAEVVVKTLDAHLVPVANGIYDTDQQKLLPFTPDCVFLTKYPIKYNPAATSPTIVHPVDGSVWEYESWIESLSDDEGVPQLLRELVSAVLRPGVRWNKAAFLHSSKGNNGKGTYCALLRNLIGDEAHTSIPIAKFGQTFALGDLIHARAIIVDENSVGAFAKDLGDFKAVITGDAFMLERKYKDPVNVSFSGMVVQCVNDFPKSRDKSASYTRRQLFIPFRKWFGGDGVERKYIKNDYLQREDVLEYVLRTSLEMTHTELSEPAACIALLDQFQRENNPVRDFWMEFQDEFVWDLLPTKFLFALFVEWYRKTHPSGAPINRNDFSTLLVDVLSTEPGWLFADSQKQHRTGRLNLNQPEPLISLYELKDWMPVSYTGADPVRRSTMDIILPKYNGVLRTPVGHRWHGVGVSVVDDDDDDAVGAAFDTAPFPVEAESAVGPEDHQDTNEEDAS